VAGGTAGRLKVFSVTGAANIPAPTALRAMGVVEWPRLEELRLEVRGETGAAVPPGVFPRLRDLRLIGARLPAAEMAAVLECPAPARWCRATMCRTRSFRSTCPCGR